MFDCNSLEACGSVCNLLACDVIWTSHSFQEETFLGVAPVRIESKKRCVDDLVPGVNYAL